MAKLAATELAKKVALEAVQMAGGYGYATEYPMERHLRAAVVTTIYGGTSEIQRNIIAKTLGLVVRAGGWRLVRDHCRPERVKIRRCPPIRPMWGTLTLPRSHRASAAPARPCRPSRGCCPWPPTSRRPAPCASASWTRRAPSSAWPGRTARGQPRARRGWSRSRQARRRGSGAARWPSPRSPRWRGWSTARRLAEVLDGEEAAGAGASALGGDGRPARHLPAAADARRRRRAPRAGARRRRPTSSSSRRRWRSRTRSRRPPRRASPSSRSPRGTPSRWRSRRRSRARRSR